MTERGEDGEHGEDTSDPRQNRYKFYICNMYVILTWGVKILTMLTILTGKREHALRKAIRI
jgi:hypothetical protein